MAIGTPGGYGLGPMANPQVRIGFGGPPPPTWSPEDFGTVLLHWATRLNPSQADGDPAFDAEDFSGNNVDLTVANGPGTAPTYKLPNSTLPFWRADGFDNQGFGNTGTHAFSDITFFVVSKAPWDQAVSRVSLLFSLGAMTATNGIGLELITSAVVAFPYPTTDRLRLYYEGLNVYADADVSLVLGSGSGVIGVRATATANLRLTANGSVRTFHELTGSASAAYANGGVYLLGRPSFSRDHERDVSEVVVYDGALSNTTMDDVTAELMTLYSLT